MKRALVVLLLCFSAGCGSSSSDAVNFIGTWRGNLPLVGNDCPFPVPLNQDQVLPVVISPLPNGQLNVAGADGSSGGGVQTTTSFLVSGPPFGTPIIDTGALGSCTIIYDFGFFEADDSSAQVELSVDFTNCTNPANGKTTSCGVLYAGNVFKLN